MPKKHRHHSRERNSSRSRSRSRSSSRYKTKRNKRSRSRSRSDSRSPSRLFEFICSRMFYIYAFAVARLRDRKEKKYHSRKRTPERNSKHYDKLYCPNCKNPISVSRYVVLRLILEIYLFRVGNTYTVF